MARRRREYALTGDRYRELAAQLAAATAQLQVLPLPPNARAAVDIASGYIERLGDQRSPELNGEWSSVHAGLIAAADALGVDRSQ